MPRRRLGARLYLAPVATDHRTGAEIASQWVIKDLRCFRRTGLAPHQRLEAEEALQRYLVAKGKPSETRYFIYFVTADFPNFPIKIGITESYTSRFYALQIGLPYKVKPLAICETHDPLIERRLHKRFAAYRLEGEWFERSAELMKLISDMDGTTDYDSRPPLDAHEDLFNIAS